MFENILEYIVNADDFYRLWMVSEMQHPTKVGSLKTTSQTRIRHPRDEWMPELVEQFNDVRDVPNVVICADADHLVDSQLRFHTGNKTPTISCKKMILQWGDLTTGNFANEPMRAIGPAAITLTNLKMWHHQDTVHRRRGDAVICEQATFEWNALSDRLSLFRASGPFQIVIKNFKAQYNMGRPVHATFEKLIPSWGTEDGIRLGSARVDEVISKHNIKINNLLTDNVFEDPMEEFIFWDEIGRARNTSL